jgi:hypothetical protein
MQTSATKAAAQIGRRVKPSLRGAVLIFAGISEDANSAIRTLFISRADAKRSAYFHRNVDLLHPVDRKPWAGRSAIPEGSISRQQCTGTGTAEPGLFSLHVQYGADKRRDIGSTSCGRWDFMLTAWAIRG